MPKRGAFWHDAPRVTRRKLPNTSLPGSHNIGSIQPFFTQKRYRANWHDLKHTPTGTIRHDSTDYGAIVPTVVPITAHHRGVIIYVLFM